MASCKSRGFLSELYGLESSGSKHKQCAGSEASDPSEFSSATSSVMPELKSDMPPEVVDVKMVQSFLNEALDEDFVLLDSEPTGKLNSLMQKIKGDITSASAGRQVAIGGVSGCVAGYLTNKVGRAVGLSLAGTFILFQYAQHKGYVKVNWSKVQRAMTKAKAQARVDHLKLRQASVVGKVQNFIEENIFLSTGFMGGFAVGFFF